MKSTHFNAFSMPTESLANGWQSMPLENGNGAGLEGYSYEGDCTVCCGVVVVESYVHRDPDAIPK